MIKVLFILLMLAQASLNAQLMIKPEEAIKAIYPQSSIFEKQAILLSEAQAEKVKELTGNKLTSRIFTFYLIKDEKAIIAYAGIYTNKVRSKTGTYLVFITPSGKIKSIEVIAFNEPPEYLPKERWLSLFTDKSINDNLHVKESLPNLSGATLSARSASDTAKLMLAVWQVRYAY